MLYCHEGSEDPALNACEEKAREPWLPPAECDAAFAELAPTLAESASTTDDAELSAASPASSAGFAVGAKLADFSGSWMLARVEGDMDAFMREVGYGWLVRSAAAAVGYGVNRSTSTITHTPTHLRMVAVTPRGSSTLELRLDGTEQEGLEPLENQKVLFRPFWEPDGSALAFESRRAGSGIELPRTRRFLLGDEMCVEQTSAKGLVIRRLYRRQ